MQTHNTLTTAATVVASAAATTTSNNNITSAVVVVDALFHIFHCSDKNSLLKLQSTVDIRILGEKKENIIANNEICTSGNDFIFHIQAKREKERNIFDVCSTTVRQMNQSCKCMIHDGRQW